MIDTTKLMKLRINKKMSQNELSLELGISRVTINKVESGRNKNPSFKTMILWCQYFDVSILSILKNKY